jgi:hypothetical protein
MKKNILYILSGLLFIHLCSCEDLLDNPPLDKISNDSYWKTAKDLENYTVNFYRIFQTYGTPTNPGIFGADAFYGSDDAIVAAVNTTLNGSRPVVSNAANSDWNWANIRSVNFFFDNYSACEDDPDIWLHFLGEAHFFRAYLYFEKVKQYGDVPWYDTALAMDSEDLYKPRDPRTLVVDNILNDLENAIQYLAPIASTPGGTNRLSKEIALLFKSRVALFEGTWQKYHAGTPFGTPNADPAKYFRIAADAAEELMTGDYSVGLYGNNIEDYEHMFGLENMSAIEEILLWKAYDITLNLGHDGQVYTTTMTAARSATMQFVESFLSKEGKPVDYYELAETKKGREFLRYISEIADPRLSKTIWAPGQVMWDNGNGYKEFDLPFIGQTGSYLNTTGFQLRKGVNITAPGAGGVFGGNDETGSIIFRYSEVLLNYAEAKYELDGQVDYDKSINLLRKRVGMPDFKVQKDPNAKRFSDYGYEISDELFEIRRERRVELGAEGYRNIDYKRWRAHKLFQGKRPKGYPVLEDEFAKGTKIPAKDENGLLDPFKSELPNGYQFNENKDYLECIPTNEITLNPALSQNPGW